MVAKDIFPFATTTDGCKKVNFMEFFNTIYIFSETFQNMVSKMPFSWENPMKLASLQPSGMVAKGKISFATMTHGCKAVIIDKKKATFENLHHSMNLAKEGQISSLILLSRFQSQTFDLTYLTCTCVSALIR